MYGTNVWSIECLRLFILCCFEAHHFETEWCHYVSTSVFPSQNYCEFYIQHSILWLIWESWFGCNHCFIIRLYQTSRWYWEHKVLKRKNLCLSLSSRNTHHQLISKFVIDIFQTDTSFLCQCLPHLIRLGAAGQAENNWGIKSALKLLWWTCKLLLEPKSKTQMIHLSPRVVFVSTSCI